MDKFPHYLELRGQFFDEVYMYTRAEFYKKNEKITFIQKVNEIYNVFFDLLNMRLDQFEEIIVGCPHYFFGVYLVSNEVEFTFLEDACGLLSRPEILEKIEMRIAPEKNDFCLEHGLYTGENKLITKIIGNRDAQIPGFDVKDLVHFDVVVEMQLLESRSIEAIIDFFGMNKKIEIPHHAMVILTQHFAGLKVLTFDEQKEIYRIVIDYFAQDYKLVFKPHPDDYLYYGLLFPEATVIKDKFPSELIPFVFTNPPESLMTITSSSINSLKMYYSEPITFSLNFERNYAITHRYYCALKLLNAIELNQYQISTMYADTQLLNNLARHTELQPLNCNIKDYDFSATDRNYNVLILDDLNFEYGNREAVNEIQQLLNSLEDDQVVIFPNSHQQYLFYDYPNKEVFEHIVPVVIIHRDVCDADQWSETMIFVYAKRREVRDMINELVFEKELKYSNKVLRVEKLTEDQMRIKVLEGILAATEKRLDYYIKQDSDLKTKG